MKHFSYLLLSVILYYSFNMGSNKVISAVPFQAYIQNSTPDSLLNLLIGQWKGKGTSYGIEIADKVEFKYALDRKFIFMQISSNKGDNFKAEGYLFFNSGKNEIEFYEFSNISGVRQFAGQIKNNTIVLNELPEATKMKLEFIFHPDGSFSIKEYKMREVYVMERFTRMN